MLVISGADLVGKTTFATECTRLLQERGYPHMLHHLSRPPECFDYHKNYVERMCVNSVWDRFYLDSLAYRQCDGHPCSMTPLKWDLVEAEFRLRCGFQVVLHARDSEISERHKSRGDDLYSLDHILSVNLVFRQIVANDCADVRGSRFYCRVDACGRVTEPSKHEGLMHKLLTPESVVDAYQTRLMEFNRLR